MFFKIEVIILARNRLEYLKKNFFIIYDLLKKNKNIYLKISDNSTNDKIKLFFNNFEKINLINFCYIGRGGLLEANEHYDIVLSECEYDYTVIFHDDDYIDRNYFNNINRAIIDYPNAVAIGTNANLIKKNKYINKKSHYFNKNIEFKNKKIFLENYLTGSDGICPFPSYVYKTIHIKDIKFSKIGAGKHSDVIFLSNLIDKGTIVWLKEKLINYRIHDLQDSKTESILNRISLKKYLLSNGINKNDVCFVLFNIFYRYNLYNQYLKNSMNKKNSIKTLRKYFIYKFVKLLFTIYFYKIFYKKLYRKIF